MSHSIKRFAPVSWLWLAILWIAAACGNNTASGPVITGGSPGVACDTTFQSQGCFYNKKTSCVAMSNAASPTAGVWTDLGDCGTGEYCVQEVDPANPAKRVAICKSYGIADAVSGPDAATSDVGAPGDASGTGADLDAITDATAGDTSGADSAGGKGDAGKDTAGDASKDSGGDATKGCGNGLCEQGESATNCAADCPAGTIKCGDAICMTNEVNTCPMDCTPEYKPTLQCGIESCATEWAACLKDTKCKLFFNCASGCGCDQGCLAACLANMTGNPGLAGILQCAQDAACPDPCAGAAPQNCGDGQCTGSEDNGSCPDDCPPHPCDNYCGQQAPSGCWCDQTCGATNDCCDMDGNQAASSCAGSTCGICK